MRWPHLPLLMVIGALAVSAEVQQYEVGPGDVLNVIVLNQPGLTGEFTVDPEGFMAYPFVGRVKAAGLSALEIERKLGTLLSDGYLKRPQISVSVKQFRSHRVFVTGEAARPGPYGLRPDRLLSSLLPDIGDLTPQARHEAPIPPTRAPYPGEVQGSEVVRVKLREVRSGFPDKDVRLQIGDTIYFPKAAQVYLTGHVARPGSYRFDENMTVFQALALAGSVTERGSMKRVRIVRLVDGRRKELSVKLTEVLEPEDTVHVPERFF